MAKTKSRSSKPASKPAAKVAKKPAGKSAKGKAKGVKAASSRPKSSVEAKPSTGMKGIVIGDAVVEFARDRAIDAARFAASMADQMEKDWPADQHCAQPGGCDNHLVWTYGHLAATYGWLAGQVGVKVELPETYSALFGYGSKPESDAGKYPKLADVKAKCAAARKTFFDAASKMTAAQLREEMSADLQSFAKDKLAIIERCAWHDGWHSGQLSSLRRALGLAGVM